MAKNVEDIEKAIIQLRQDQLKQFRAWYEKFDSDAWDEQIEKESTAGKFDSLANAAITDHKSGKSKEL